MRQNLKLLLVLLTLSVAGMSHAAEVQDITSKKGIHAWMIEEKSVPIIAARFVFARGGAAYDPKGKEGLSNLVSSLLNEGAGDMGAQAFQKALEEKAIRLGGYADEDFIVLSLETLSEHKEEAFRLAGLALRQPRFDEEAMERMRAAILSALRQLEASPGYLAGRAFRLSAFGEHPYGRPTRGTEVGVNAITKEDLTAFAQAHFSRDVMTIAVVGDIDANTAMKLLDENFAELPATSHIPEIDDATLPETGLTVRVTKNLPQSVTMFGLNGVARKDPDYFAAYILNYILGGDGLTARLSDALRNESGLAYYASSSLETNPHAAMLTGNFATRAEKVDEATTRMKQVIATLGKEGVSEQELTRAKNYLTGTFPLQLDSNRALANYLVAMQVYDLGQDYLSRRNDYIRAVTLEDVNRVAQRLLDPSRLVIAIVGPAPAAKE